jgi:hypothetical protein
MKFIKLFESFTRSDNLYHTPHIVYFNPILSSDSLLAHQTKENACSREFPAVSLTRNMQLCYDEQPLQFKINRSRLEAKYKVESYVDPIYNGQDLEEEEITRVHIDPLSAVLDAIQFTPSMMKWVEPEDIEDIIPVLDQYLKKHPHVKFEIIVDGKLSTANPSDMLDYIKVEESQLSLFDEDVARVEPKQYMSLTGVIEYPRIEDELITSYLTYYEYEEDEFMVTTINPVEWFKTCDVDGSGTTIEDAFRDHSEAWQHRLVKQYRKDPSILDSYLIICGDELVDGFHRLTAMALNGVTSAKAIDIAQVKGD